MRQRNLREQLQIDDHRQAPIQLEKRRSLFLIPSAANGSYQHQATVNSCLAAIRPADRPGTNMCHGAQIIRTLLARKHEFYEPMTYVKRTTLFLARHSSLSSRQVGYNSPHPTESLMRSSATPRLMSDCFTQSARRCEITRL